MEALSHATSSEGKDGECGGQGEGNGAKNLSVLDNTADVRVEANIEVSEDLELSLVQEGLSGVGLGGLLDSGDGQVEVSVGRVAGLEDAGVKGRLAVTLGDDAV